MLMYPVSNLSGSVKFRIGGKSRTRAVQDKLHESVRTRVGEIPIATVQSVKEQKISKGSGFLVLNFLEFFVLSPKTKEGI